MTVVGKASYFTVKVNIFIQMETSTKEILLVVKKMEKVYINIKTAKSIKVHLKMILKMVLEFIVI